MINMYGLVTIPSLVVDWSGEFGCDCCQKWDTIHGLGDNVTNDACRRGRNLCVVMILDSVIQWQEKVCEPFVVIWISALIGHQI
jgi:hypothetical protein